MDTILTKIRIAYKDKSLRRRVLFVLGALAVFRLLASVPIPGVDVLQLEQFLSSNQFLGLLNIFSGGGLSNLSIVMLGVGPFITASIVMQLLTLMSDKLKALYHEEGDAGKKKVSQYSRLLSVPLAGIQGFSLLILLQRGGALESLSLFGMVTNVIVIAAGSILLMWIGELMTEYGIGNGVSLIIFAGIVSGLPATVSQIIFSFDVTNLPIYIGFLVLAVAIVAGVVVITEAERPIPITYAKKVRGNKVYGGVSTYLPLRLNQSGVIPIIFALSILLFPQMIFNFLSNVGGDTLNAISTSILGFLANSWVYGISYFILVFLFTYFYTAVTFDPDSISTNLQRSGAFIPGVRPGASTASYISTVLTRITLTGALFLGVIAVLPILMQALTGLNTLAIGGTALLIAVTVVIELVKKIDAQISMREY